jgi:bacteriorhodopsin
MPAYESHYRYDARIKDLERTRVGEVTAENLNMVNQLQKLKLDKLRAAQAHELRDLERQLDKSSQRATKRDAIQEAMWEQHNRKKMSDKISQMANGPPLPMAVMSNSGSEDGSDSRVNKGYIPGPSYSRGHRQGGDVDIRVLRDQTEEESVESLEFAYENDRHRNKYNHDLAPKKSPSSSSDGHGHGHHKIKITQTPMARQLNKRMSMRAEKIAQLHTPYLDHYSHMLAWWTQYAFTAATFTMLYFSLFHDQREKTVRTFFVIATAALAYYAKCEGLAEISLFGQGRVPIVRYVDWVLTTPIMLGELCHIGHAPNHVWDMVIGCDLLMLACGIASALIPWSTHPKPKMTFFIAGGVFYVIMVFVLHRDVAAGSAVKQSQATQDLFSQLEILTMVVWSFYPIVCGLGRAHGGLISVAAEDAIICIMDMSAKIGMEGILIYWLLTNDLADGHGDGHGAEHAIVTALVNGTVAAATGHEVHL